MSGWNGRIKHGRRRGPDPDHPLGWSWRFGCVLLAISAVVLAGCGTSDEEDPSPQAEPALELEVWTLETEALTESRRWTGRLESLRAIQVQSPGPARVASVEVRDGDRVSQGDLLMRLAAPGPEARRGVLAQRLEHLEEELARWRRLAEAGAAGPAEVSEALLRSLEVREELEAADAVLEGHLVRAPASGQVASIAVGVGAEVQGGAPLLRVDDADTRGVRITVAARETAFLEATEHLRLRDDGGTSFEVERVAYTPAEHPGFVSAELYLRRVEATDAEGTEAIAANGDRPGQVDVTYEATDQVLLVPWTAVASDGDGHWVALLTGDPSRIERRFVELGRAHSAGIEVLSGLSEGDRVVRYEPRAHPEGREVRSREPSR